MRTNTRPDRVPGSRGGGTQSARPEQRSAHGGQAPKEGGAVETTYDAVWPSGVEAFGRGIGRGGPSAMRCHDAALLVARALDQESNRCPVAHRPSRSHAQGRSISVCAVWKITDSKVIPIVTSDIDRPLFSIINQYVMRMYWWRRRESNPRPQALRLWLYMLSRVF